MKKILLTLSLVFGISAFAQDDKTVTLVVSGQGKTQEESRQNALRSAIEQAFGAFISSKTEVLNDTIIKDEIVSVTNGNIQKYEIISEVQLPYNRWASTLKATVSIYKLTSFCESKGVTVEFKGGLFAMNIKLQELYRKNEKIAWDNCKLIITSLLSKGFNSKLTTNDPVLEENNLYSIPIIIELETNEKFKSAMSILRSFCKSISLTEEGAVNYKKTGSNVFLVSFPVEKPARFRPKYWEDIQNEKYIFRNGEVAGDIIFLPWIFFYSCIKNIRVRNNLEIISLNKSNYKLTVDDIDDCCPTKFPLVHCSNGHFYKLGGVYYDDDYTRGAFEEFIKSPSFCRSADYMIFYPYISKMFKIEFNYIKPLSEIEKITEFKID